MLQTVKAQKVDEKFGVTCLVSMFSSRVIVLKFPLHSFRKWCGL